MLTHIINQPVNCSKQARDEFVACRQSGKVNVSGKEIYNLAVREGGVSALEGGVAGLCVWLGYRWWGG